MSALQHGFFRRSFMLCDRCVLSGKCESFVPSGECAVEKRAFEGLVSELIMQYGLDGLADEILVERVAMYLVRIARIEVYEASVGVSDASVLLGKYVAELDKALRSLLKDLALTRGERKRLEKGDVLVDVDRLLNGFSRKEKAKGKKARKYALVGSGRRGRIKRRMTIARSLWDILLADWNTEKPALEAGIRGSHDG